MSAEPEWLKRLECALCCTLWQGFESNQAHKCGIHPGFETQGGHHYKSNTEVSVASQEGHIYF